MGEAAAIPARVRIRQLDPDQLLDSNDIEFADGWAEPPVGLDAIERIVRRWRREPSR